MRDEIAIASCHERRRVSGWFELADLKGRRLKFPHNWQRGSASSQAIRGHIDSIANGVVSGWVDNSGPVHRVDFCVNGEWVAAISPTAFRPDLYEAGIGDGCRSFSIDISPYIPNGIGQVSVLLDGKKILDSPHDVVVPSALPAEKALELSQRRWRGNETYSALTWGRPMSGDTLVELYSSYHDFSKTTRILEIGPGYGRFLRSLIEADSDFHSYFGLELSSDRVDNLAAEFDDVRVNFAQGDVMNFRLDQRFDLIVSSATFEHLYPDCRVALRNLRTHCEPGGILAVDFIRSPEPKAYFEENGTYIRVYSLRQLHDVFSEAELEVHQVHELDFGMSKNGNPIERWAVVARPKDL